MRSRGGARSTPLRILVLGGGFGGLYTAIELEKQLADRPEIEITLVNRDNFFSFTPMLHEVAASDLDMTHIVNPVRKMLTRTQLFLGDVQRIDLDRKHVVVEHGSDHHAHALPYDHLVIGLGAVTNFFDLPGLAERALTMKSLGDAVHLRNQLIANLEEADTECAVKACLREPLMTCVVAGGGFAGVETIAGVNDFVREALHCYRNLHEDQVRMVLVHPGDVILPELSEKLGRYAQQKLAQRGVEIRLNARVTAVTEDAVHLSDGTAIKTRTVVWAAGSAPNPLLADLACAKDRGRLIANEYLEVPDQPGVWALGDCAVITDPKTGKPYPPTAQHALRQSRVLARNLAATIGGKRKRPFVFSTLGQLASIGRRIGVANIFGINFSGFVAWWLWRTIYLSKLPRAEKKIRVALDWTLDLLFSKDVVQYGTARSTPPLSRMGEG
jgi:NADH:ubiquinone reductase (H+-translocating)